MGEKNESCNFLFPIVMEASVPNKPLNVRIKKRINDLKSTIYSQIRIFLYPKKIKER
jgi:hypothetical protein